MGFPWVLIPWLLNLANSVNVITKVHSLRKGWHARILRTNYINMKKSKGQNNISDFLQRDLFLIIYTQNAHNQNNAALSELYNTAASNLTQKYIDS